MLDFLSARLSVPDPELATHTRATLDYMSDAHGDAPAPAPATNKRHRVHEPGDETKEGDYAHTDQEWMTVKESTAILKRVHEGIAAGRQPVKHDAFFPLHAQWNSFPFGSNEHYAVACALGKGMPGGGRKAVGRHRPFFDELRKAGLIDDYGWPTKALEEEVKLREELNAIVKQSEGYLSSAITSRRRPRDSDDEDEPPPPDEDEPPPPRRKAKLE